MRRCCVGGDMIILNSEQIARSHSDGQGLTQNLVNKCFSLKSVSYKLFQNELCYFLGLSLLETGDIFCKMFRTLAAIRSSILADSLAKWGYRSVR